MFAHLRVCTFVLDRECWFFTKFDGGMPRPARIEDHAARESDDICLLILQNIFRLLKFGNQADGNGWNFGLTTNAFRERHLIIRTDFDVLFRNRAAA